jgi:hypothetical protein
MKRAIRVLAISDLVLAIALTPVVLVSFSKSAGNYLAVCGSPGKCLLPFFILSHLPDALIAIIGITIFIAIQASLAAGFTLSLVITTLAMVVHNRRDSRGWFAVFVILTSILALSPGLVFAGVLALSVAYPLLLALAALSSLVALLSTFFLGEGDESS